MKHAAIVTAFCLAVVAAPGCSSGSEGLPVNGGQTPTAPDSPASPTPPAAPQLPAISGDVIGMPGTPVPGLAAHYVWTGLGWLGSIDDVVFEAVIRWDGTNELGCGILRSDRNGLVNLVLMQGQTLSDSGGGHVKHPALPIAGNGQSVVISVGVEGGSFEGGLYLVDLDGTSPELLAIEDGGLFKNAVIADDGTVLVAYTDPAGTRLLAIHDDETTTICDACRPQFSTDGTAIVAHDGLTAWLIGLDGTRQPLLGEGDAVPGLQATVESIAAAWITAAGVPVVHARTDNPDRPDAIVRFDPDPELVAACGELAPGSDGTYLELHPAAGSSEDVVFGALLEGDDGRTSAIFCARPGQPVEMLAATGDTAGDLGLPMAVSYSEVVATVGGGAIFAGVIRDPAQSGEIGVFTVTPEQGIERRITTNARVTGIDGGTVTEFLYGLREAMDFADDGRTLVHVGVELDRQPGATYGVLIRSR